MEKDLQQFNYYIVPITDWNTPEGWLSEIRNILIAATLKDNSEQVFPVDTT